MESSGLHVCVVDDDSIYQFITKRMFDTINPTSRLTVFSDGREAIDYITKNSNCSNNLPDLILLDINMPIMNGWEFLQAFAELVGTLCKIAAVYVVSSSVSAADRHKVKEFSCVIDYLFKPLAKDKLKEILVPLQV